MYSIIVLAHNKSAYTRACLESLLSTGVAGVQVLAVDNGSTDDTREMLAELPPRFSKAGGELVVIRHERNVGCSTARNECMAVAKGEYIVFLDNDTLVWDPNWLTKMSDALKQERNARIVGPKICYPFEPHWIQCAGVGISRSGRVQFRGRGKPREDRQFGRREEVQAVISACMMFDAGLPRQIGGLDEVFNPIQYEDLDFCYRAREKGHRVIYTPDPEIYHWESITSEGTAALPNKYLIVKHGAIFKRRWRHIFEKEQGPPDEETKWQVIEMPSPEGRRKR